jgi:hypothetical protein
MRFLILSVLILASSTAVAQEFAEGLSPHQAGLAASSITGYGAAYSYDLSRDYRIKTKLLFYFRNSENSNKSSTFLGGLEFQRTLQTSSITRFYALIGGYMYNYHNEYSDQLQSGFNSSYSEHNYVAGIGIGFDVLVFGHIVINLDAGAQYYTISYSPSTYSSASQEFGFGGGGGIMYRF